MEQPDNGKQTDKQTSKQAIFQTSDPIPVQYSTVQYSAVQYSTVQYSTVQYMCLTPGAAVSVQLSASVYSPAQIWTLQLPDCSCHIPPPTTGD